MNTFRELLRSGHETDGELTTAELLAQAPLAELDGTVRALKTHRPATEIRTALVERIARAPLSDFQILKTIYLMHCLEAAK